MFKRDFVAAVDPETGVETALFNPRIQNWNDHFRWDEARTGLVGLTAVGRATVLRMRSTAAEQSARGGAGWMRDCTRR